MRYIILFFLFVQTITSQTYNVTDETIGSKTFGQQRTLRVEKNGLNLPSQRKGPNKALIQGAGAAGSQYKSYSNLNVGGSGNYYRSPARSSSIPEINITEKEQALSELKEKKEWLDLGLITKSEYESYKKQYSKIITGTEYNSNGSEINKYDVAEKFLNTGNNYYNENNLVLALDNYKKALAALYGLDSTDDNDYKSKILVKIGGVNVQLKEYLAAIISYDNAINLSKTNNALYYNNRAATKRKLGLFKEALIDYNVGIAIDPTMPTLWGGRGTTKNFLGDSIGACNDWEKGVLLGNSLYQKYIDENCNKE